MKPLHVPLIVVGLLAPFLLTAQSLHLTGSNPASNSANVALTTTVSFTFDQPLKPGTASLDSIGEQFIVIPNDKIVIHQMDMTPDGKSLVFAVSHMAEVDYTWVFFGLQSTTGQTMTDFNIVTYTTFQTLSPVSVEGRLIVPDSPEPVTFSSTVVMLMRNLSFMEEEDGGGPENDMLYATIPNPTTGAYSFNAVKPGSYYVLAMMFNSLQGRMDPIRVGIYRNAMQEPIPLVLSTTSVTGLDLVMEVSDMGPTDPIDAVQAFQYVESVMSVDTPTAEPIVMEGYASDMPANGDSDVWMMAYFNEADSIITMLWTDGFRINNRETMHLLDMPATERPPVDLATIKPIPTEFVPSRAAYQIALQNGLGTDIMTHSPTNGEVWQNMSYRLAHFYFEFPDLMTIASNPYWLIRYDVQTMMGGLELMYLVDAVTGNFIARVERQEPWNPGGFELVSADPSSLTANLPLQTRVSFTFSEPINVGTLNLESRRVTWTVLPEDRVQLHQMTYSEDFKTVFMDVTLTADTDYVWSFQGIRSANGLALNTAEVVNHTTKASVSPLIIAGSLIWPDPMLAPHPDQAMSVVMLLDSPDYFLNGMNGPPTGILNVGVGSPDSWMHTMENVRPGTYYPAAFVFDKASGNRNLIAFGFLPDLNDNPRSITITDQSFTRFNMPLWYTDPDRERPLVDATYAFAKAEARMATLNPQARLIAIEGRSQRMPPSGDAQDWSVIYFSDADSIVTLIRAGERLLEVESFHYLSMPPDERVDVDLSTVKSIPDVFVRSRAAYQTAIQNGLGSDLARFQQSINQGMDIHYQLGHFYWEYPEFTNVTSNPFWDIQFNVYTPSGNIEFTYLVDAVTGLFIGRKETVEAWQPDEFELMASNPAHLSVNVPLQTEIRFTFSEPIRPETLNLQSQMRSWGVLPADKIIIHQVSYTDYNRTVVMQVTHQPDTDYVWFLQGVTTQEGGSLRAAEILNYTTASSSSPLTIGGSLIWPDVGQLPSTDLGMALVMLLDSPDYLLGEMTGPPPGIRNIGSNDPGSWTYRIENVRPGTYYPAAFVLQKGSEGNSLIAYGFLPDEQGAPRSITLTDQSFTQVNMPLWFDEGGGEHHPIDVTQVIGMVRNHVASQGNGADLITAYGREEIQRPMMPTGTSFDWSFIYYESATDTVQVMMVGSDGIFAVDRFHVSSVPEEERIPKELVRFLPNTFIGSGQAMMVARSNGLDELINSTPSQAWTQVRFGVSKFYFQYPDILNSESPPFWDVQYNAEIWDNQSNLLWSREANFLIDAITGAFIHKRVTTDLDDTDAPLAIELDQNVPNPFNPTTVIRFTLDAGRHTRLAVYDILGRQVAVLVDGAMPAGSHHVTFDGSNLPSGVYLYRLESGGKTLQRKFTLIK